ARSERVSTVAGIVNGVALVYSRSPTANGPAIEGSGKTVITTWSASFSTPSIPNVICVSFNVLLGGVLPSAKIFKPGAETAEDGMGSGFGSATCPHAGNSMSKNRTEPVVLASRRVTAAGGLGGWMSNVARS